MKATGDADVPSPVSEAPSEPLSEVSSGAGRSVGPRTNLQVQPVNPTLLTPPASDAGASSDSGKEDERNDRRMFSSVEKPRLHYDAEVITKLVVYAGKCR